MVGPVEGETSGATVSSRPILARARLLRSLCVVLECVVALVVSGSVAAIGSVHPWAYVPLWIATGLALVLLLARGAAVAALRQVLGPRRFAFHAAGRWLVVEPRGEYGATGWGLDLGAPAFPRGPLLVPGLAFLAWGLLQVVPWPPSGRPLTLSPAATLRGLAFAAAVLTFHQVAAAVFAERRARERFRRVVAALGLVLALVALVQVASGSTRVYGLFAPLEGGQPFGPFVNRNHFAGYMLMVVPVSLAVLARALRRYEARVGTNPNPRRRMVALQTAEGAALLYAAIPPLFSIGALVASTSRGAILAFAFALALAGLGLRRARGVPAWAMALAFAAVALSWFGLERLEARFTRTGDDAPGRTVVWWDALARMPQGQWLTGSGLNTFGLKMSRVPAWSLPIGATPWPEAVRAPLESGERFGYRAPDGLAGMSWYREAHNDYVQVLVETGVPGLLIALWAALAVLAAARSDPWLLAALAGVLLHELVDFDLQIPALAVLFATLSALGGRDVAREPA